MDERENCEDIKHFDNKKISDELPLPLASEKHVEIIRIKEMEKKGFAFIIRISITIN